MNRWTLLTGIVVTIAAVIIRIVWETRPSRLRAMDGYDPDWSAV